MSTPDLGAVLDDLHYDHDPEPPAPDVVAAWCARFPAHACAIRAHVAAWVRSDLARNRVPLHYRAARRGDVDGDVVERDTALAAHCASHPSLREPQLEGPRLTPEASVYFGARAEGRATEGRAHARLHTRGVHAGRVVVAARVTAHLPRPWRASRAA